jgi:hypothetical protein
VARCPPADVPLAPRGLLKHMPTMVQQCNVTETQIMGEVLYHEEYLQSIGQFKS